MHTVTISERQGHELEWDMQGHIGGFWEKKWKGKMLQLCYNLKNIKKDSSQAIDTFSNMFPSLALKPEYTEKYLYRIKQII